MKIEQGIDPDVPTPEHFKSDPDSEDDELAAEKDPVHFNFVEGEKLLSKPVKKGAVDELEQTLKCAEDEALDIAVEGVVNRYIIRQEDEFDISKLQPIEVWRLILKLVEKEDFSKSFELSFKLGDDIYFLRLCLLCGAKVIGRVNRRTAIKILRKLSEIRLGNEILSLNLAFIEKGIRANLLDFVDHRTGLDTLEALKIIADSFDHTLKKRAIYLYNLTKEIMKYN